MTQRASGQFEVKVIPQPHDEAFSDPAVSRLALDKRFHGDLDAISKGEMLAVRSAIPDSGSYVALERVVGTLSGRRGSFALQHRGVMKRGAQELLITVVPDSGTDELSGISGTMAIDIEGGAHSYVFDYELAATP